MGRPRRCAARFHLDSPCSRREKTALLRSGLGDMVDRRERSRLAPPAGEESRADRALVPDFRGGEDIGDAKFGIERTAESHVDYGLKTATGMNAIESLHGPGSASPIGDQRGVFSVEPGATGIMHR